MIIQDDRTDTQRKTHTFAVVMTDRFLSGWGRASGGASFAAWACTSDDYNECQSWVESRSDAKRVRTVLLKDYRPRCAHLHIYVFTSRRDFGPSDTADHDIREDQRR